MEDVSCDPMVTCAEWSLGMLQVLFLIRAFQYALAALDSRATELRDQHRLRGASDY